MTLSIRYSDCIVANLIGSRENWVIISELLRRTNSFSQHPSFRDRKASAELPKC